MEIICFFMCFIFFSPDVYPWIGKKKKKRQEEMGFFQFSFVLFALIKI